MKYTPASYTSLRQQQHKACRPLRPQARFPRYIHRIREKRCRRARYPACRYSRRSACIYDAVIIRHIKQRSVHRNPDVTRASLSGRTYRPRLAHIRIKIINVPPAPAAQRKKSAGISIAPESFVWPHRIVAPGRLTGSIKFVNDGTHSVTRIIVFAVVCDTARRNTVGQCYRNTVHGKHLAEVYAIVIAFATDSSPQPALHTCMTPKPQKNVHIRFIKFRIAFSLKMYIIRVECLFAIPTPN